MFLSVPIVVTMPITISLPAVVLFVGPSVALRSVRITKLFLSFLAMANSCFITAKTAKISS